MSSTITFYEDTMNCPNCGEVNIVNCISEQDTAQDKASNDIIVGQTCSCCGEKLEFER